MTELDFQRQVVRLASLLGWESVHFRPAMTKHGWRTAGSGSMAKGWPDLVLVRERDRRLIFAELKASKQKATPEQHRVLEVLRSIEHYPTPLDEALRQKPPIAHPSIQVFLWHPEDFDQIGRTLR